MPSFAPHVSDLPLYLVPLLPILHGQDMAGSNVGKEHPDIPSSFTWFVQVKSLPKVTVGLRSAMSWLYRCTVLLARVRILLNS